MPRYGMALAALLCLGPIERAWGQGDAMAMSGNLGNYPMSRESSGTSWQPDSAPNEALMAMTAHGMRMWQGNVAGVYTDQSGPRGDEQWFNTSMLMFMANRSFDADTVAFRAMASLEPLMGPNGYPLLFQTGETGDGQTPLIDRQHPHNLLMEVAGSWSHALSRRLALFLYGGPVGEPALGPPVFLQRFSSETDPEAPLTHHWLDATHVTFGLLTAGLVWDNVKIDASVFNGREPDEHRYSVQFRSFDSNSWRVSWNPTAHWALQVSSGYLASPEQLTPDVSVRRTTASAIYDTALAGGHWQTTLAFGRDAPSHGPATDGFLLDSTMQLGARLKVLVRYEHVVKDELFQPDDPLYGRAFLVQKVSGGAAYEFARWRSVAFSAGLVLSTYPMDAALKPSYGDAPSSYTFFVRAALVP
jgi:hypothetical protein